MRILHFYRVAVSLTLTYLHCVQKFQKFPKYILVNILSGNDISSPDKHLMGLPFLLPPML